MEMNGLMEWSVTLQSDFLEQNWLIHNMVQGEVTQWVLLEQAMPVVSLPSLEQETQPIKMCSCWLPQTDSHFDLSHTLWMFCWRALLVFNLYIEAEWLFIYDARFSFKFAVWEMIS